ncbi:hypothetical protein R1flu_015228 [Riccia fluitans]|uniref:CHORD domain-containing protein n=1 Tax=Riccia fluitans TaxID=41844 RepID=A0ABD1YIH3_9MARC
MATVTRQRCQRIGCNAMFTPDDNPEDSCRYHPGIILAKTLRLRKEWGCCKKRSHDFSLFLDLPGCQTGKHTSEKPQLQAKPVPVVQNQPLSLKVTGSKVAASDCNRCRQGFFCSDHGTKVQRTVPASTPNVTSVTVAEKKAPPAAPLKIVDLNATQICKNQGCGKEFTEKENTDTACSYHPGPAIFHDRSKGWKCCDVHVKEFDEFLDIPPCTKGWHNANPDGQ